MKKCVLFLLTLTLLTVARSVPAQGTAFTYQGRLSDGGGPANGNYDFTFALFNNSSTNSGQVGNTLTNLDVGVSNGLFTVTLDFGSVFTGDALWLAIGVQTNGGVNFTALSPLQELTPAPYAMFAPNAGVAASANAVAGSNIVGTISVTQVSGGVLTNGQSGVNLSGAFSGDGSQLSNVTASTLATNGLVPGTATNVHAANGTYTFIVPPFTAQMVVKLWGAGAGAGSDTGGGGGAFSQVTLNVTAGETYVLVVGQSGRSGGGAGANDGSGGAGGIDGGTGGQASSLFKFTGSAYIMKAVAGGGGGGGQTYGGNAGQASGSGAGYSTNATTIGETNLNLMGGDGTAGGADHGGGGGGYGGGGLLRDGQSAGGGSYGDLTISGSLNLPGNTSDPNYLSGSAYGGNDGLAVVLFSTYALPVAVLPSNLALRTGGNAFTGNQTVTSGNVGIGTNSPTSPLTVVGNIQMGSNGTNYAASSGENLRIVRGVVNADGSIFNGTGFTVSHPNQGVYNIQFSPAFSDLPAISTTTWGGYCVGYVLLSPGQANLNLLQLSPVVLVDKDFTFIAIGAP